MNWKWKLAQAAEIRWWKHYLAKKAPEAYLQDKRTYWIRVMQQANIQVPPQSSVLDAGCGPAGIFMVLGEQEVDALDPLLQKYAADLPHFNPENYPGVHFIAESLERYAPEAAYDQIFCLNAINHVADIQQAMDQLVACLQPAGKLWLSIDAHRYPELRWIFQRIPGDILHPHQYTLSEYREMLTDRGLEVMDQIKLKPGRIFDYYLLGAKFSSSAKLDTSG